MTVSKYIHCLVDAEPEGYYETPGAYAVNLSFECFSDDVGDEQQAQVTYNSFLDLVQCKVRFVTYRLDGNRLVQALPIDRQLPDSQGSPAPTNELKEWLSGRAPTLAPEKGPERFWTRPLLTGTKDLVDAQTAGAGPLLRAAQAWNAPVGHHFGLTYLIWVRAEYADCVVLPYFGDVPPQKFLNFTCVSSDGTNCELLDCVDNQSDPGDFGSGISGLICRTAFLKLPKSDTLDDRLTKDGYFKVNPDAIALRRLLTGFEHCAAGLLAVTPALMPRAKVQDAAQVEEAEYEKLFDFDQKSGKTVISPIATWAAVAGLLTALDNIVIALMKPIAGSSSEGEVLAPLISDIVHEMNKAGLPGEQSREVILNAVRNALGQSPLIRPSDSQKKIPALRHVHRLSDKAGTDAPIETQLLLALLENAENPAAILSDDLLKAMGNTQPLMLLMRALSGIQAQLAEETGAEAAIIRLFETAAHSSSDTSVAALIAGLLKLDTEPVSKAWISYCATLNGPFNGAEAVRRSASLEFINAIFLDKEVRQTINGPDSDKVVCRIQAAAYFARRLTNFEAPAAAMFSHILKLLVRFPPPDLDDPKAINTLIGHFSRAYEATMRNLGDLSGEGKRFIPDMAPQPLPLQIAGDVTGQLFDHFLDDFNGIAIAISRDTIAFAHANLAELHWGTAASAENSPRGPTALHPFLPSVNDGRGPAFVEYHGIPFADASFAKILVDAAADENDPTRTPFYQADVVRDLQGQPPLPRLAYGCRFQSFAFAVTNAGTLPKAQRLSEDLPWLPGHPIEPSPDLIASAAYQRRTAIGELEILEVELDSPAPLPKDRQRLNRNLPNVVALASDYPRVSMVASPNALATLDLYRESDGVGTLALAFGKYQKLELSIRDVQISSSAKCIWLCLLDGPVASPFDNTFFHAELNNEYLKAAKSLRLLLTSTKNEPKTAGDLPTYTVNVNISRGTIDGAGRDLGNFQAIEGALIWLRLVLKSGTESPSAMSFAAPEGPKGSRPAPSLLLLAASSDKNVWRPEEVTKSVRIKIKTPRVGYLDFQRWMANSKLRDKAFGDSVLATNFEKDLLALYTMRSIDPKLTQFFDRLPDPAVAEIRLTLCETDRLMGGVGFTPRTDTLSLATQKEGFRTIARNFTQKWQSGDTRGAINNLMQEIDNQFSFIVTLSVGEANLDVQNHDVVASIPVGSVAHFTIEAMVPPALFSFPNSQPLAPLHAGLLQYASCSSASHHAFPAASLCIEAMADAIPRWEDNPMSHKEVITLAYNMIGLNSAASARRYDLVAAQQATSDNERNAWRVYSHATVISQQWLFSGRPLYRALNPKKFVWGRTEKNENLPVYDAALRLKDSDASVFEFENELFFDRSNINADSLTRKLEPLPARTVLQTVIWDSPSASYWRHRFTLRSRYAGALQTTTRREVDAFLPIEHKDGKRKSIPETWTLRAAMFADLVRIQLTRPQLRALIPLTIAVADGTPSVLAVLQEPPLAHGGLADRISAELKTGFGYGFASADSSVEIRDARKEVGPDPTLTYSAMPRRIARGLALIAEGPVGLTFDPPHASAPIFANTMFSLTPTLVDDKPMQALEEHFLGILMQRHLDPDWLPDLAPKPAAQGATTAPDHDADQCWWIEVPLDQVTVDEGLMMAGPCKVPILDLKRIMGRPHAIMVSKAALDGVAGFKTHYVKLVTLPSGTTRLALLHQPVAPGHYGLSIFMPPPLPDIARGHSVTWLKVASVEWSPPKQAPNSGSPSQTEDALQVRRFLVPKRASVRASAASATTFLEWTRTHRDFANLTLGNPERSNTVRAQCSELIAHIHTKDNKFELNFHYPSDNSALYLTSSTEANPHPLHKHRHLGFMLTRLRDEPGRPMEEFVHQGLMVGHTAIVPNGMKGRMNVRLIEIETPAVILSGTQIPGIPHEYRRHILDLVATGSNATGQLKLVLRLVGSEQHLNRFKRITLRLELLKPGQLPTQDTAMLEPINVNFGANVRGIEFYLHPSKPNISISLIHIDGVTTKQDLSSKVAEALNNDPAGLTNYVGLLLSIDTPPEAGECWCDISMLHSDKNASQNALDLRWLYSRDAPGDIALALQPGALAARTEAQARIVSVSPPIAVVPEPKTN